MFMSAISRLAGSRAPNSITPKIDAELSGGPDQRVIPRHETKIAAKLCLIGRERDCVIHNVSIHGMTVAVDGVDLCVGVQVLVSCAAVPALCGTIRWIGAGMFGVQFVKPLALDQVYQMRQSVPAGMQVRAGRARVQLPAVAGFSGQSRTVEIQNLSVGGLMMALVMPPKPSQHLMIELPGMLPLGGHVRWSAGGRCGVMFSKLLPMAAAEELTKAHQLPETWLDEVRIAHKLVELD